MTIIVAFILDAFVFRMNYSRKNREPVDNPEGALNMFEFQAPIYWMSSVHFHPLVFFNVSFKDHCKGRLYKYSVAAFVLNWPTGSHFYVFILDLDENGIVFEVEVSRDEALATLELYKQTCPGLSSLSSLQGVLQAMDRSGVRMHIKTK